MYDETINQAINKLSKLLNEDFHGFRCEVWNIISDAISSAERLNETRIEELRKMQIILINGLAGK